METIHVLGIAGSPRRHGNTEILLDRLLDQAEAVGADVRKIVVSELDMAGCSDSGICYNQSISAVEDAFQDVNRWIVESDVIALAAPLFFWNVPAQTKALIDRGQIQWVRKVETRESLPPTAAGRSRRRGVFICVGGNPHRHFKGVVRTVKSFFRLYEVDYWGELLYHGIEAKGEIEQHPAALQAAAELGFKVVTQRD